MKKGTRIWTLIPSPIQALLAMIPHAARVIFRKRRAPYMSLDQDGAGQVQIKRNHVIQFNAFLRIEKTKVTNINKMARPVSELQKKNTNK